MHHKREHLYKLQSCLCGGNEMFDFSSGPTFALSDFGSGAVFGAEVRPQQQDFLMS